MKKIIYTFFILCFTSNVVFSQNYTDSKNQDISNIIDNGLKIWFCNAENELYLDGSFEMTDFSGSIENGNFQVTGIFTLSRFKVSIDGKVTTSPKNKLLINNNLLDLVYLNDTEINYFERNGKT